MWGLVNAVKWYFIKQAIKFAVLCGLAAWFITSDIGNEYSIVKSAKDSISNYAYSIYLKEREPVLNWISQKIASR